MTTLSRIRDRLGHWRQRNYDSRLLKYSFNQKFGDAFSKVEIETVPACNRACAYCPVGTEEKAASTEKMSKETFQKVVDDLADMGYVGTLSPHRYNEPLLDNRLVDLLGYARDQLPGVRIKVFTNGDLLTPERYRELREVGAKFSLSIHWEKKDGTWVREPSENLKRTIESISEEEKAEGFVNVHIFDERSEGLMNRGGALDTLEDEQSVGCPIYPESPQLSIDSDGNVLLCCHQYSTDWGPSFGNVKERHVRDIWNDSDFRQVRAELTDGEFRYDVCKDCQAGTFEIDADAPVERNDETIAPLQ